MTYAAKVGFWVILTAGLVVSLLVYFGVITISGMRRNEYYLHFHFPSIRGLNKGAKFKINGNEVGFVERTDISRMSGVDVMVRIFESRYVVHENANVVISKESLLGSSYVEVHEPIGGYFDGAIQGKDGYFYLQVPQGQAEKGDFLQIIRNNQPVPVGVIEEVTAGDPGHEKCTVKLLDKSYKFDEKYAFVPSSIEIKNPVTNLIEKKTVIDVFAPLAPDSYFEGSRESGPEELIAHIDEVILDAGVKVDQLTVETSKVIIQVQTLLDELGGMMDKKQFQDLVKTLKIQIEKIGSNMDSITAQMEGIVSDNQPRLDATMANVEATSKAIKDIAEDPELGSSLKDLTKRLTGIADHIDKILMDIEDITSDPTIKGDIKDSIHSVHSTLKETEKTVTDMKTQIDKLSNVEFSGEIKSRFRPDPDTYFTGINLYLQSPKSGNFITLGIDEIGEDDLIDAQIGYSLDKDLDARFGIKRSKVGAGMDYHLERFFLRVDVYNPNEIVLDAYTGFGIGKDLYLVVGDQNIFDEDIFNIGVMFKF